VASFDNASNSVRRGIVDSVQFFVVFLCDFLLFDILRQGGWDNKLSHAIVEFIIVLKIFVICNDRVMVPTVRRGNSHSIPTVKLTPRLSTSCLPYSTVPWFSTNPPLLSWDYPAPKYSNSSTILTSGHVTPVQRERARRQFTLGIAMAVNQMSKKQKISYSHLTFEWNLPTVYNTIDRRGWEGTAVQWWI
jgi:hypothetical protein